MLPQQISGHNESIVDRWEVEFITLSDLKFDRANVYYFNSMAQKTALQAEIRARAEEKQRIDRETAMGKSIELVAKYFREFYDKDRKLKEHFYMPLGLMLADDEIEGLRKKFEFDGKNARVIEGLFFDKQKPNFLEFISNCSNLSIDPSQYKRNGQGILQHLLLDTHIMQFHHYVGCLFRLDYVVSDSDALVLEDIYKKHSSMADGVSREYFEKWITITHMNRVQNRKILRDYNKVLKVFLSIASLKYKKPVHFNFKHLIQVTHNLITGRPEYTEIFLQAMRVYGEYEKQLAGDASGKLKSKLMNFSKRKPKQNWGDIHVVFALFPELKEGFYYGSTPF